MLEPFGEVCGGCQLQFCCGTCFTTIKNKKKIVLQKNEVDIFKQSLICTQNSSEID